MKVCRRDAPSVSAASSISRETSAKHRLDRSHDEGQADEGQRHDDARRLVGDRQCRAARACRRSGRCRHRARSARSRRPRSEARTADRSSAPNSRLTGKAVADQHPGDEQAEHAVDRRGDRAPRRTSAVGGERSLARRPRSQNASQPPLALLTNTADSGMRTMNDSQKTVMPSDRPKPGRAEDLRGSGERGITGRLRHQKSKCRRVANASPFGFRCRSDRAACCRR